jgi:hypothetical protein
MTASWEALADIPSGQRVFDAETDGANIWTLVFTVGDADHLDVVEYDGTTWTLVDTIDFTPGASTTRSRMVFVADYSGAEVLFSIAYDGTADMRTDIVTISPPSNTPGPPDPVPGDNRSQFATGWLAGPTDGGRIIVAGGYDASFDPLDDVQILDVDTATWTACAPLPIPLAEVNGCWHGGLFYVFGGWAGSSYLARGYVYDPDLDSWATLTVGFPTANAGAPAVVSRGGLIYVLGGWGTSTTQKVWRYDPDDDTWWNDLPDIPSNITNYSTAVTVGGDVWLWELNKTAGQVARLTGIAAPLAPPTNLLIAEHFTNAEYPGGDGTLLVNAEEVWFQDGLADAGSFYVVLPDDDDDAQAIDDDDYIVISVVGSDSVPVRAFVGLIEKVVDTPIAPGEEAEQTIRVEGSGHLIITNDGCIEPPGGVGRSPTAIDFVFDFTHPDYVEGGDDEYTWITPTEIDTVENAQGHYDLDGELIVPATFQPLPLTRNMPAHAVTGEGSGTTMLLWSADGSLTGGTEGKVAARGTFTAPSGYDGVLYLFTAGVHMVEAYVDAKQLSVGGGEGEILNSGYTNAQITPFSASANEHTLAIKATRFPDFTGAQSAGFTFAVYIPGFPPPLVAEATASSVNIVDHPDEWPGMTVGKVLLLCLAMHSSRFGGYINPTFDADQDSANEDWETLAQIAARAGYDTVYTLILKCISTYADIRMRVDGSGWDLDAYNWGTLNPNSGVTFEVGNLTSFESTRVRRLADEILNLWSGGFSSAGSGQVQKFLELGPENTPEEVERIDTRMLGVYGNPREMARYTYDPSDDSELPYVNPDFVPGCNATRPTRPVSLGGSVTDRIVQITCAYTKAAEKITVEVVSKDLILQEQERFINALRT